MTKEEMNNTSSESSPPPPSATFSSLPYDIALNCLARVPSLGGEAYDPKTQTWEPILPTALDLTVQKSVFPGCLVMDGKVYKSDGLFHLHLMRTIFLVEIENMLFHIMLSNRGDLIWHDPNDADYGWRTVKGGRRVQVWWKSVVSSRRGHKRHWTYEFKTKIWCAEVRFERRGLGELWGFVERSKNMFTLDGRDSPPNLFLHSAIVTH
ncbi:hypothetical protein CARUB_v10002479mg [Capsella rubella]|uniref:Uncharacterized protein n=1 Tax=Capsella rubella TaxID=81985 RepID=R0GYK6_9BRAS|nr:hypothetical protein CARUB_v10002479mg [Capsella rubella]